MIGIIGAMASEVDALIFGLSEKKTETLSGSLFTSGILEGKEVVIVRSGIGKVAAATAAEAMILRYAPTLLINTGVGGSLSEKLSVTDIAIADRAVEHDMDTTPLGDPPGLLSGIDIVYLPSDTDAVAGMSRAAETLGYHAEVGTIASGDRFVASAEEKGRIVSLFGAIACDMEGAAISHVAYLNGTPAVILRAISDSADGSSHMDYPTFLAKAAERSHALLKEFLRRL
ncbi:MAG TPA: 5'-methylthioadenosine/adenosylhomocysteine nucleosidase [Clostridiales bacterium]|nr:5'-methylthioadenosine/adenosylhomocysteine nucleosidase [Clostridiales bacterium]